MFQCDGGKGRITQRSVVDQLVKQASPAGVGFDQHGTVRRYRDIPAQKDETFKRLAMGALHQFHTGLPVRDRKVGDGLARQRMMRNHVALGGEAACDLAGFCIDRTEDGAASAMVFIGEQHHQFCDHLHLACQGDAGDDAQCYQRPVGQLRKRGMVVQPGLHNAIALSPVLHQCSGLQGLAIDVAVACCFAQPLLRAATLAAVQVLDPQPGLVWQERGVRRVLSPFAEYREGGDTGQGVALADVGEARLVLNVRLRGAASCVQGAQQVCFAPVKIITGQVLARFIGEPVAVEFHWRHIV